MSDTPNLYVYGITEQTDIELTVDGVGGESVLRTVEYRSLVALVTDIDTTDPDRSDEAVAAHDSVLQTVIERDDVETVVPMGFGMAFKNARTLKGVMRGARRALRKALNDVEGCVELGVKLVGPAEEMADTDELRDRLESELAPLSVGQTDDDLFSDRLVANRSYLVEQDRREAFDDAIDAIDADYEDVLVRYTGPWAPYNFVDIRIGAEASR